MNGQQVPIRIQGGVFIWFCAFMAVVSSVFTLFSSGSFWRSLFGLVVAVVLWLASVVFWDAQVVRRYGSSAGEEGPLAGLASFTAAVFIDVYCQGGAFCAVVDGRSYVSSFFLALLVVPVASCVVMFLARGLNRYGLNPGRIQERYNEASESIQIVSLTIGAFVVIVGLLASITLVKSCLREGFALGTMIVATASHLVFLSILRKPMVRLWLWFARNQYDVRFIPKSSDLVWGGDFSLAECVAAAAGGCLTAFWGGIVPGTWGWLLIPAGVFGFFCASVLELAILLYNNAESQYLRSAWRAETLSVVVDEWDECQKRRQQNLREIVLASLDIDTGVEWKDQETLKVRADRIRRLLNFHLCEEGRMCYLVAPEFVKRGEILADMAKKHFDKLFGRSRVPCPYTKLSTDEDLFLALQRMREWRSGKDDIPTRSEVYRKGCVLMAELEKMNIRPACRFLTEVRCRGGREQLSIDFTSTGNLTVMLVREGCPRFQVSCTEDLVVTTVEHALDTLTNV